MKILSKKEMEGDWELSYKYIVEIEKHLLAEILMTNTAFNFLNGHDNLNEFKRYFYEEAHQFKYYILYTLYNGSYHAIDFTGFALDDSLNKESLGLVVKVVKFCAEDFKKNIEKDK